MKPFIKNHRPPTYYGVKLPATWDSHTMWRCTRHIPSSKVYPAFMEMCPSCKQPRPPEEFRPADPYAPPAAPVAVVTPPSDKCPKCGDDPLLSTVCAGDFLELPPAKVTEESLENMRTLRDMTAELNFNKDMSLGQAQRDLDAEVMGVLFATADALTETTGCMIPPALTEEFPEPAIKAKKARCPGPGCRKNARESSPYCSKICSDRCLRLRKKATTAVLTKTEVEHLNRIVKALENWGKR